MNLTKNTGKLVRRVLALALTACFLLPLVACSDDEFSYKNADLSQYLSLQMSDFEGKPFDISLNKTITDEEFDKAFEEFLMAYGPTEDVTDVAAKDGDTVKIYYKGVQEADGKEVAFDGGTYMSFGNPYSLTLGSDSFIEGFEDGLIGVIPQNTYKYSTDPALTVATDSYVHVNFTATYEKEGVDTPYTLSNGKKPKLINLSKCVYGDDFVAGIKGESVGSRVNFDCSYDADGDGAKELVTFTVEIVDILQVNPHAVEATFPAVYPQNQDLAGKTVKFYVWVEAVVKKTPAEINDDLWEKIGYTTKEKDVLTAFKKEYRESLQAERDDACDTELLGKVWELLMEKAQVKKYPAGEVESMAKSIKEEVDYQYEAAQEQNLSFDSYEAFVLYYFGLTDKTAEGFDANKHFEETAQENIKSKLIAWYLCDRYDIKITQKQLSAALQEYLQAQANAYTQQYGQSVTAEQIQEMYAEQYGENYLTDYVEEMLYSQELNEKLVDKVTVKYGVKEE